MRPFLLLAVLLVAVLAASSASASPSSAAATDASSWSWSWLSSSASSWLRRVVGRVHAEWGVQHLSTGQMRFSSAEVADWLAHGTPDLRAEGVEDALPPMELETFEGLSRGEAFTGLRRRFLQRLALEARTILGGGDPSAYTPIPPHAVSGDDFPYYQWIPVFEGGVTPSSPIAWSAGAEGCFQMNKATLAAVGPNQFNLTLSSTQPASSQCSDFYLLANLDSVALLTVSSAGVSTVPWSLDNPSVAEMFDIHTRGVRVFRFRGDWVAMLSTIVDTLLLFEGELTAGIPPEAAERNRDFLAKYAGVLMPQRNGSTELILDESLIHSGDFFGIMRLDGMDPLLAWAMGSETGHTTVALWIDDALHVCESTTKAPHWPTNGIQCTPYRQWLAQVKAAGQNAVWAPLTPAAREKFNESAAIEWLDQQLGLDYGFHNLLFGWLDTVADNYPCLPPDYQTCLGWDLFEVVFGLLDRWVPPASELLFREALSHRLGAPQGVELSVADMFMAAAQRGLKPGELVTVVEQDDWSYNTTRSGVVTQGRSMVCCVFVCSLWKAAGVFGALTDGINCAELTNADDYALSILDAPPRPDVCVAADPLNPLCQVEGEYQVILAPFAFKPPYAHMAEHCPSKAPEYKKPGNC